MTRFVDPIAFDRLAVLYDRYLYLTGARLRDYLVDRLPLGGQRAVDLACGTGVNTELLADIYTEVLAVDGSTAMLEVASMVRPRANVSYMLRDPGELTPALDGRFDLVFSAYALHHLRDRDGLPDALARIRELAAPGGTVIIVDVAEPPRTRHWLRAQAVRCLAEDLRHRRRPPAEAVEVYRLATHPAWLDHQVRSRYLRPPDFDRELAAVFPGARFTALQRSRAMWWRAG